MNTELFVDGEGRHVEVHERNADCDQHGCCIHNPTNHPLRGAPLVWKVEGFRPPHMVRICEHQVAHPDFDGIDYMRRIGYDEMAATLFVHACDGCCLGVKL